VSHKLEPVPNNFKGENNMPIRSILTRSMAAASWLAVPSLVQAGVDAFVTVGPLATPVPTVSGYLLIVLGLLLAVIAFRTLRNNQGAHKLLGILVLGGGLIISGIGVDRTIAGNIQNTITVETDGCTSDADLKYDGSFDVDATLENKCGNPIEIKGFASSDCNRIVGGVLDKTNAGCKQGQVLAVDEVCTYLPKCPPPPPD